MLYLYLFSFFVCFIICENIEYFQTSYERSNIGGLSDSLIQDDGTIIVFGYTDSQNAFGKLDLFVGKFNDEGEPLWTTIYGFDEDNVDLVGTEIIKVGTTDLYISGTIINDTTSTGIIVNLDPTDGSIKKEFGLYSQSSDFNSIISDPSQNNRLMTVGRLYNGTSIDQDAVVITFDESNTKFEQVIVFDFVDINYTDYTNDFQKNDYFSKIIVLDSSSSDHKLVFGSAFSFFSDSPDTNNKNVTSGLTFVKIDTSVELFDDLLLWSSIVLFNYSDTPDIEMNKVIFIESIDILEDTGNNNDLLFIAKYCESNRADLNPYSTKTCTHGLIGSISNDGDSINYIKKISMDPASEFQLTSILQLEGSNNCLISASNGWMIFLDPTNGEISKIEKYNSGGEVLGYNGLSKNTNTDFIISQGETETSKTFFLSKFDVSGSGAGNDDVAPGFFEVTDITTSVFIKDISDNEYLNIQYFNTTSLLDGHNLVFSDTSILSSRVISESNEIFPLYDIITTCSPSDEWFGDYCNITKCNDIFSNLEESCSENGTCIAFNECNCTMSLPSIEDDDLNCTFSLNCTLSCLPIVTPDVPTTPGENNDYSQVLDVKPEFLDNYGTNVGYIYLFTSLAAIFAHVGVCCVCGVICFFCVLFGAMGGCSCLCVACTCGCEWLIGGSKDGMNKKQRKEFKAKMKEYKAKKKMEKKLKKQNKKSGGGGGGSGPSQELTSNVDYVDEDDQTSSDSHSSDY